MVASPRRLANYPRIGQSSLFVSSTALPRGWGWAIWRDGDVGKFTAVPMTEPPASLSRTRPRDELFPKESALLESWEAAAAAGLVAFDAARNPVRVFEVRPLKKAERENDGIDLRFDHPALDRLPLVDYVTVYHWAKVKKHSVYSLDQFADILERALVAVRQQWRWWPERLVITFYRSNRSMGLATRAVWKDDEKRVSLNAILLEKYSAQAIYRTLVHELAHHKRDEESEIVMPKALTHDRRFCELLAMVDELVDPEQGCAHFNDDLDVGALESSVIDRGKISLFSRVFAGSSLPYFSLADRAVKRNTQKLSMKPNLLPVLKQAVAFFPEGAWRSVPYHCFDPPSKLYCGPSTVGGLVDHILASDRFYDHFKIMVREATSPGAQSSDES